MAKLRAARRLGIAVFFIGMILRASSGCCAEAPGDVIVAPLSHDELARAARLAADVTIYRDAYGVPHIHGKTDEHVAFGYAYAQAEDYFWQVEDSYILALGRYSEVHGRQGLNSDLINRAFEVVPLSKANFERLEPRLQDYCSAFALGLNYYLAKHPETKPRLIAYFEPWHPLAFGRHILLELCFRYTGVSGNYLPRSHDQIWAASGSNGWAIAPSKTKDGHAILFVNPHLPSFGFSQMHEAQLRSDEGWTFSGATMLGSCVPTMGHNEHLGWTFTTNEPNIANTWRLTFDDPQRPLHYRFGDGYREATETDELIKIRSGSQLLDHRMKIRRTHLGPIVKQEDSQHYLAARIAGLSNTMLLRQQMELVKARNLAEFKSGLAMQQFPIMNVIYADREGNIFYLYNGLVPKRDPQFNWSEPLDGANPRTAWQGLHTIDELPQLLNPPDGYVQNCNSTPFTTCDTPLLAREDYPPYMIKDADDDKRRAKISRELLCAMRDVTFEDVQRAAFDTNAYWAQHDLKDYRQAHEDLKQSDPVLAARVEPYLQHLLEWDGKVTLDSTAATLCEAWYEELYSMEYPAETLKPQYAGQPAKALLALVEVANNLRLRHGDWRVPWGTLFRVQRTPNIVDLRQLAFDDKRPSVPSTAAPGPLGVVYTGYYTPSVRLLFFVNLKQRYNIVGTSYLAVYEFGDQVRGATALNFGQSGDPSSPHFFDQAKMLSEGKLKRELFAWPDVISGAKLVYHPGEPPLERVAE